MTAPATADLVHVRVPGRGVFRTDIGDRPDRRMVSASWVLEGDLVAVYVHDAISLPIPIETEFLKLVELLLRRSLREAGIGWGNVEFDVVSGLDPQVLGVVDHQHERVVVVLCRSPGEVEEWVGPVVERAVVSVDLERPLSPLGAVELLARHGSPSSVGDPPSVGDAGRFAPADNGADQAPDSATTGRLSRDSVTDGEWARAQRRAGNIDARSTDADPVTRGDLRVEVRRLVDEVRKSTELLLASVKRLLCPGCCIGGQAGRTVERHDSSPSSVGDAPSVGDAGRSASTDNGADRTVAGGDR